MIKKLNVRAVIRDVFIILVFSVDSGTGDTGLSAAVTERGSVLILLISFHTSC